jgi:Na+-transporting methylmalonyl-CoA/oxaloacetate decarboxylase gamma subunit
MSNDFVLALEITTLGMGLVFAALILLWWMMALLTSSTSEKESASSIGAMPDSAEPFDQTQGGPVSLMESDDKAQVAAIAVAFALAQEETGLARPLSDPPTAIVSAWQLGMRTKQLYQKGERIKRQTRKTGS